LRRFVKCNVVFVQFPHQLHNSRVEMIPHRYYRNWMDPCSCSGHAFLYRRDTTKLVNQSRQQEECVLIVGFFPIKVTMHTIDNTSSHVFHINKHGSTFSKSVFVLGLYCVASLKQPYYVSRRQSVVLVGTALRVFIFSLGGPFLFSACLQYVLLVGWEPLGLELPFFLTGNIIFDL